MSDTYDSEQRDYTRNFPDPMEIKPPGGDTDPFLNRMPDRPLSPGTDPRSFLDQRPDRPLPPGIDQKSLYQTLPFMPRPRGLYDMATANGGSDALNKFFGIIGGVESSNNPKQGYQSTGSIGGQYQQSLGFQRQYGGNRGNRSILDPDYQRKVLLNFARAALRRNPGMTLAQFYTNYHDGTGVPGQVFPAALGRYGLNQWARRLGVNPNTPLADLIGNADGDTTLPSMADLRSNPPVRQRYFGNPYRAGLQDFGRPDYILKAARANPGPDAPGYMPQPDEISNVLVRGLRGLMNSGLSGVSMNSLAGLRFWAAFLAARQRGQMELARVQHEQAQWHIKEAQDEAQNQARIYSECLAIATDPKHPDKNDVNAFKDCIADKGFNAENDKILAHALERPDKWTAVENYVRNLHDNWLHVGKAKTAADKQDNQNNIWGTGDGTSAPSSEDQPSTTTEPTQPPATTAPPTTAPAPATGPTSPVQPTTNINRITYGKDPAYNQQVTSTAMGTESPEKQIPARTQHDAQDLLARIQQATTGVPSDQIVPTVTALNPEIGRDLQDTIDFGPAGSRSGTSQSPRAVAYQSMLRALAHRADPTWYPEKGAKRSEFEAPNGRTQLTLQRSGSAYSAGMRIMKDLENLPKGTTDSQLQAALTAWLKTKGGDYRFTKLFNDWSNYAREVNTIIRGGAGSVQEAAATVNIVPEYFGTVAQYRAVVSSDAEIAQSKLDALTRTWNSFGNRGLPVPLTPSIVNGFTTLSRVDPETGKVQGARSGYVVGRRYTFKDNTEHVFTGAGDPNNPRDTRNWEAY